MVSEKSRYLSSSFLSLSLSLSLSQGKKGKKGKGGKKGKKVGREGYPLYIHTLPQLEIINS